MTDGLRVGLLLFALLSALAAVPLLWHHLRPRALLWLHATGIGIGLQTAEWGTPPAETGHSLTDIYLILLTLMTISGQSPRWPERTLRRVGVAAGGAVLVCVTCLALLRWGEGAAWLRVLPLLLALGFAVAAASPMWRAARRGGDEARGALATLGLAAAALLLSVTPSLPGLRLWPLLLAMAGALCTARSVAPHRGPSGRDGVVAVLSSLAITFTLGVLVPPAVAQEGGMIVFWLILVVLTLSRPLLAVRPLPTSPPRMPTDAPPAPPLSADILAEMTPIRSQRARPARSSPSMAVQFSTRQLLEAAFFQTRSRSALRDLPLHRIWLHLNADDDVSLEGDPAELSEALALLVDNALGLRDTHPSVDVDVHVRSGGPYHVAVEISDDLLHHLDTERNRPRLNVAHPFGAAVLPGLPAAEGIAIARARALLQRGGGALLIRKTPDGSTVQATLRRHLPGRFFGQA